METKRRGWLKGTLALLLMSGLTSPVVGQTVNASMTGTVTDVSGAVLKGASVTAVNKSTNVEYPTKSNDAGVYVISGLPLGRYVLKAEAQGFKLLTTNAVSLEAGQIARINLKLELGQLSEAVQVEGVNPILQTENAVVGDVVTAETVTGLPLNGRNFSQLTLLLPGVQTHSPDTFNSPKQNSDSGRPYINGQREQSNNFMLDGIDMNEAVDNLVAYYPSPDAIAEIRIETNNYSAEFGNVAGGIISTVTKSGTNEFHGNAFEFARNDKFDANSWANDKSAASKSNLSQNIFGATLGGPVVKNKVFFFADYQGQMSDRPGDATATVAPAAWRNGDFSSLLPQGIILIDPQTGQPFPNNQIPTSRFSPIAQQLLANQNFYPLPNRGGLTGNYVHTADNTTKNHQGDFRLDAKLSSQDSINARVSIGKYNTSDTQAIFPLAMGNGFISDAQNVSANWTHIFSSTAVNELRAGFSHVTINETPVDPGNVGNYDETLGIPISQPIAGLSALNFGNSGIDTIGTQGIAHDTNNKTWEVAEKLSLSRGRHYLSLGAQLLHYNMNQLYASNSGLLGSFNFGGTGFGTGFGFSNFLLDQVFQKQILLGGGGAAAWTQLQNRVGVFIQDDWKAKPNLTVNIGLRWEYSSPITEAQNHQVNFDVNTGQELIPGQNGVSDATTKSYYGGFSPRVGFAWSVNDKTVVRGGFGIVQYQEGTGANCRLPINPPYYLDASQAYSTPGSMAVGFNDLGTANAPNLSSIQLRAWQTDLQPQLTKQWNIFFERELGTSTSFNIGYVGSRATHVVTFNDDNMYVPGVGDPANWAPFADRRRLPQYGFIRYTASDGTVNYNGLQASLRRRASKDLEFMASYTLSKTMSDNQGFYGPGWGTRAANQSTAGSYGDGNYDAYNLHLDYGPAWFSALHSGAFSANYQLPFGHDRAVGSNWTGVTQALLGGWNVSPILTVRSGLPITVVEGWGPGRSLQTSGFTFERPNLVPGANPLASSPSWSNWLNINAFAPQPLGTFGNSPVGVARGPWYYNLDMSLDKNISMGGSRFLTLRVEAFNLLNHPNMGLPQRDITSPTTFGQILETASGPRILEFAAKFTF